jgi:hypothetical protein
MYRRGQTSWPKLARQYTKMELAKQHHITILFLILMTISHSTLAFHAVSSRSSALLSSLSSRALDNSSLLDCLQVAPPVLSPDGECQQTLMVHTFAYSYGQPFVGKWHSPSTVIMFALFYV